MCSVGAEQQDGSTQCVSVPIELLSPHGGEKVGEDFTDVPVHSLQGHIHALTGRLVQEALQAANIWRKKKKGRRKSQIYIIAHVLHKRHIKKSLEIWRCLLWMSLLPQRSDTTSGLENHNKRKYQQHMTENTLPGFNCTTYF